MAKSKEKKPTKRAEPWLAEEGLALVEGWAKLGLSEKQIAYNMGIAYSTLKVWKNDYSALSAALKSGKEVADFQVMNALHQNAMDGNVTAQIFWLKNRMPEHFRDRVEYSDTKSLDKLDQVLDSIKEQADGAD